MASSAGVGRVRPTGDERRGSRGAFHGGQGARRAGVKGHVARAERAEHLK